MPLLLAVATAQLVRWIVWSGLVGLTVALLVLMRTRWGQSNPLRKCIVLSLLAHLLLGIYATTVSIVSAGGRGSGAVRVSLVDGPDDENSGADDAGEPPGDRLPAVSPDGSPTPDIANPVPEIETEVGPPPTETPPGDAAAGDGDLSAGAGPPLHEGEHPPTDGDESSAADVPPPDEPESVPIHEDRANTESSNLAADAPTIEGPAIDSEPPSRIRSVDEVLGPRPSGRDAAAGGSSANATGRQRGGLNPHMPGPYQRRVAGDRLKIARAGGGSAETEAAVAAALAWLAANQSNDGRWNVRRLEGAREVLVDGQDRGGAGSRADAGITGLALLAFLAGGHTHVTGDHAQTVQAGLEFLISNQSVDGCLAGDANFYEKMYSHAMATCALSEAYGMTADRHLEEALSRAIGYTLAMQHPQTGGWRYQRNDPGDTSQLGWQLMSLKSAELAGMQIPAANFDGAARFLSSVAQGRAGGLACYRPGHRASRPMTAEALACRMFLGQRLDARTTDEAMQYLLAELPGQGTDNFYYWYYGTLSLFQVQGEPWQRWNQAMQTTLLGSQRSDGKLAGSWNPDAVWGAYGGRAYSTALGTLCLEVYYRYLPLYMEAAGRNRRTN